jgi:hypothetical protein
MKMDCTDCGRTCSSVRDLENHRRQEHCVASCHLCGKPFFSQNHLSVHLKQVHDIGQKEDGKHHFVFAINMLTRMFLYFCRTQLNIY